MERLKKFAATTQAQLKEATSQINSPLKATTSVPATAPKTDNEGKSLETLKKENEMLQKNMTNLVEDFTKLNVQLNDYKAKVYDLENRKKSYSSEVKQLQKQVNEAEVKLRRKSITLKKTKDGDILEKLVEDNDNYREQVHILKNTIREMSEKMKKQAQSGATATKAGTSADSSSTPETATTASDGSDKEETPTGDGSVGKNVDGSKTKELQERLDSIVKERDEIASKFDKAQENHGKDLQQLVEKLTAKEEEIQQAKKKGQENYDKLVATQDRLKEMGKKLEMMVNAYQTLQKSSAASASKQEELDKAKTRIVELEEQVNAIDLDAINKAHEDKIKSWSQNRKGP